MSQQRRVPQGIDDGLIALRVAREIKPGEVVNLGIGLPTLVADYLPEGVAFLHAEIGIAGYGRHLPLDELDEDYVDAGSAPVEILPGASFFASAEAFAMIRGRHVDVGVLGAYQVSERGDVANWMVPSRGVGSIGGAMDVAAGCRRLIVAMRHCTREGAPRILRQCTYPLTAPRVASLIVTDLAVIAVTQHGLSLREVAPGLSPEKIQEFTGVLLALSPELGEMRF